MTPADRPRFPDPTPEPAVHAELPDDALLVFLPDVHIGGVAGVEIFDSPAELVSLLEDLGRHRGPVELVLVGDFLDLLRMGDPGRGGDLVAATLTRPEYWQLLADCWHVRHPKVTAARSGSWCLLGWSAPWSRLLVRVA